MVRSIIVLLLLYAQKNFKDLRMGDYLDILNALVDAEDDDEIDRILRSVDKR